MINQLSPEFEVQTLGRSDVATFPRSGALFIRSCRSLSKECLGKSLKSERSALFFKTAGCIAVLSIVELFASTGSQHPTVSGIPRLRYPMPLPVFPLAGSLGRASTREG